MIPRPMREMPMRSLGDRPSGRGRMIRGKETGKEKEVMERARGKEEVKPEVAREVLLREAVSFVEALIGPPNAFRTISTKTSPPVPNQRVRADLYPSYVD